MYLRKEGDPIRQSSFAGEAKVGFKSQALRIHETTVILFKKLSRRLNMPLAVV